MLRRSKNTHRFVTLPAASAGAPVVVAFCGPRAGAIGATCSILKEVFYRTTTATTTKSLARLVRVERVVKSAHVQCRFRELRNNLNLVGHYLSGYDFPTVGRCPERNRRSGTDIRNFGFPGLHHSFHSSNLAFPSCRSSRPHRRR